MAKNEAESEFQSEELQSFNESILQILRTRVTPSKFKAFFESNFSVTHIDEKEIHFVVPTAFIKKMIENFYLNSISEALYELINKQLKVSISLLNTTNPGSESKQVSFDDLFKDVEPKKTEPKSEKASFIIDGLKPKREDLIQEAKSSERKVLDSSNIRGIDTNKTFDNFIVGPASQMAHAFCLAVAKSPGTVYPQLYIYGNSGLGKTHLLHAVSNHVRFHNPAKRICFLTATDFMAEMVDAIQKNKQNNDSFARFRRKYTEKVDLLIIDDIHELEGKARTQSEFFYIFNELQARKKQLIFTSDKTPDQIYGLEDRIKTRLNSALIVDIQNPDLETRIAILKSKAQENDIFLDDEVITLIASSVKNSVRELEGKLIRLAAFSTLMNVDIDVEIAKQQLNLDMRTNKQVLDIDAVCRKVADHLSIPLGDIVGKSRKKDASIARHIAMYLCHRILEDVTLEDIGYHFSGRDHSTVIHALKKMEAMLNKDKKLSQTVYQIEASF